ncbi:hypothetical protein [Oceaniglobus trochenteri]|uniref:hypothetical protein n=1 Tax=Oceaniglobus trochenteri TaxID=2763260 RepID=UPI001CFF69E4|nr:hypothetical protein [Oceaniglobus trochenteri]
MRAILLPLLLLALAACARPLSVEERAFAATVQGAALNPAPVRIAKGALIGNITRTRPPRPALACRERIRHPETGDVRISTAAFVLFDRMFAARRVYRDNYLPGYPDTLPLARAMFIAHEMTHVWQWQNRAVTGYHPLRAAAEHRPGADPYLFDLKAGQDFLSFGYEQQGGIVEEFVCCRALDPEGARTRRLYQMLRPYFPGLEPHSRVARAAVTLPWKDAPTAGICS